MAIISISGYAGAGKNLVGDIIKYLTSEASVSGRSFDIFQKRNSRPDAYGDWYDSPWECKSWAYKLKLICSTLTGIPVEKFEDQEFKKTYLPEQWSHWAISITDKDGTVEYQGRYDTKDCAEGIISIVKVVKGTRDKTYDVVQKPITVREMLQRVGTDCLREGFNKNVWINALMADYVGKPNRLVAAFLAGEGLPAYMNSGKKEYPNWIITDTRFLNEVEAIKKVDGKVIRVVRDGIAPPNNHPSEMELADYKGFDYVIENNGTVEDLIYSVSKMMQTLGFEQKASIYNYQK